MPPLCEEKAEILPNMIAGIANKNTRRTTTTFCKIYASLNISLYSQPAKEEANVMKTGKPPPSFRVARKKNVVKKNMLSVF